MSTVGPLDGDIQPVFLLSRALPVNDRVNEYVMCLAGAKVSGRGSIIGAQKIGSLWRIYPSTMAARLALLTRGINIAGRNLEVQSQNPFIMRNSNGEEIPSTRLTISDIPLSVSNDAVESALTKKGLKLRSKLKMEAIRDPDGKLTEWLSGRRFVWIDLPNRTIEPSIPVGQFKGKLYYREMKAQKECRRCFAKGHVASQCSSVEICRMCKMPGHRAADCLEVREVRDSHSELGVESETEFPSLPTVMDADSGTDHAENSTDECDTMWETVERKRNRRKRSTAADNKDRKKDRHNFQKEAPEEVPEPVETEGRESMSTTFTIGQGESISSVTEEPNTAMEESPDADVDQTSEQSAPQDREMEIPEENNEVSPGGDQTIQTEPTLQNKIQNNTGKNKTSENRNDTLKKTNDEGTIPHFFKRSRQLHSNKRPCPDTSTSSEGTPTAHASFNTTS